jgi:thimet oligopeptidase
MNRLFAALGAMALAVVPWSAVAQPEGSPIAEALARADAAAKRIAETPDDKRTFENTVGAIDDMIARLNADTSMLQFMQYVSTDPAERARGARASEDYSNYLIEFGKREDIFRAVNAYAQALQKPDAAKPEGERARLLAFLLRDFRRDGMELPKEKREKLKQLQKEITRLGLEFERTIRDDNTTILCTRDELAGMPHDFVKELPRAGDLYVLTMDYPVSGPIREQCEIESTRAKVWTAFKRRAGTGNVATLETILKLRAQAAEVLGYPTYADFEEEVLMSKSSANVMKFYEQLRPVVRKKADVDFKEFQDFKRAYTGNAEAVLRPWDYEFVKSKLLQTKYSVDPQKIREYFPMQAVVDGLFSVTQKMYGIEYKDITSMASERGRPIWHPEVKLYEITDKASGKVLGEFYVDMFPRENKYKHAACWGLLERKVFMDGTAQKPLAAMVCNFSKPSSDKPSLLTHEEVETYFHEFGHCLHNILTEATLSRFAGTSVERDFVEAPSQMFENWVWNADVLSTFAKHYQTGETLPKDLLERMIKAKHLGSGLDAENQFFYGLTDMAYHTAPKGEVDTTAKQEEVYALATHYRPIPGTYYQASFGHLVGYQAGYYGYMWSLVYAQDMSTRFKDKGLLNPEVGMEYRKKILSRGGTMDGLDMVKDFLGRDPDMNAFLEHLGLKSK